MNGDTCRVRTWLTIALAMVVAFGVAGSSWAAEVDDTADVLLPNLLPSGIWAPPMSVSESLLSTGPTQTDRTFRNGSPSDCDLVPKAQPGTLGGSFVYNTYAFRNDTVHTQCVEITYAQTEGAINAFATVYDGTFDPADISANYLADSGSSPSRTPVSFSFLASPGQDYVIVVATVSSNVDTPYTLTVRQRGRRSGTTVLLKTPVRILDSRPGSGAPLGGDGPYAPGSTQSIQVTGTAGAVPAGALGVIGNVTAVSASGNGNLRLFPDGEATPAVSTVNFTPLQNIANGTTVLLSADGKMNIFVGGGANVHVLFDVTGYIMKQID